MSTKKLAVGDRVVYSVHKYGLPHLGRLEGLPQTGTAVVRKDRDGKLYRVNTGAGALLRRATKKDVRWFDENEQARRRRSHEAHDDKVGRRERSRLASQPTPAPDHEPETKRPKGIGGAIADEIEKGG